MILFFIAVAWPRKNIFKGHVYEPLISWEIITTKFSWSIIFLVGLYIDHILLIRHIPKTSTIKGGSLAIGEGTQVD